MDEVKQEQKTTELKKAYEYTITRYTNGQYDINGVVLEGDKPSIDKLSAAKDIIEFGPKLDRQLLMEEVNANINNRVIATINQLLTRDDEQQAGGDAAEEADPTKA